MIGGGPRPLWLRPAAVAVAVAVHAALLVAYRPQEGAVVAGPITIEVVSDPTPEAAPTPESLPAPEAKAEPAAVEPEPPPPEPEPLPPEPTPEPPPEPPAPAPEPPPVTVERPKPKTPPPEPKRPKPEERPRRVASPVDSAAAEAARAEAEAAGRAAVASYAAEVSAELRRHRHYPAAAREAGITGVVVVAFVIGPGGRVATHSIVRSSGHPILDQAVHGMMSAVALPPPPGGIFRSTVPVRFDLTR